MGNMQRYTELINKYLDKTASVLSGYLNNILPKVSNNWWEKTVIEKMTDDQKKIIRRKEIESLDGLDLAAMLRIFDMNWNEISQQYNLLFDDRNTLKGMQAVRNHWKHEPITGYNLDDILRDFDTIQRFLKLLGADQKIIEELQRIKLDVMQEKISNESNKVVTKNVFIEKSEVSRNGNGLLKPINPNFACRIFLFSIHNGLLRENNDKYEATRKYWKISEKYRDVSEYEFAVGLVKGISLVSYRINKWICDSESKKYIFEGEEISEFEGFSWYKQINDKYWLRGQHFVVEFDGKGKFNLIRPNKGQWFDC